MDNSNKNLKVLDCKVSDNAYLHKDFHGALCYSIKYLDENYSPDATKQYLQQVAKTCFAPLTKQLKKEGLTALEKHLQEIFDAEDGDFNLSFQGKTLVLTVRKCPAITHLKKTNQLFTDRYCQTSVTVNETICAEAGFRCSCEYQGGKGRCVQKFWKDER